MQKSIRIDGITYRGVLWTRADKSPGSRKLGWEAIRQMLKNAKRPPDGARDKPGLFVFNTCTEWIQNVPVIPRDGKDPDDVDTEANDHQADSARYRIFTPIRRMRVSRTHGT